MDLDELWKKSSNAPAGPVTRVPSTKHRALVSTVVAGIGPVIAEQQARIAEQDALIKSSPHASRCWNQCIPKSRWLRRRSVRCGSSLLPCSRRPTERRIARPRRDCWRDECATLRGVADREARRVERCGAARCGTSMPERRCGASSQRRGCCC